MGNEPNQKNVYFDDADTGPQPPAVDLQYALPSDEAPDAAMRDRGVYQRLSSSNSTNDAGAEMLPWFFSPEELVRALPTDKPEDRDVLRRYITALMQGGGDAIQAIDTTGIRPAILRMATTGVRKLRMQQARGQTLMRSMVEGDLAKSGKKKKLSAKSMEDGNTEKDSTASLRAAELARRLKEKENEGKVNKSIREIVEEDLRKAAGEGSRGGRILAHTKSGKPIYASGKHTDGYSRRDHKEAQMTHAKAADGHEKAASKASKNEDRVGAQEHNEKTDHHRDREMHHGMMAGEKKD